MVYHLDPQTFLFASHDMHCLELAALDTLQHSLAGDPEYTHCFPHGQEVVACFSVEASNEGIGQSNAPRCTRCGLLTGNDTVIEQAVKCRRGNGKRGSSLPDGQQFTVGYVSPALEARDIPMVAEAGDVVRLESMTVGRGAPCRLTMPAMTLSG